MATTRQIDFLKKQNAFSDIVIGPVVTWPLEAIAHNNKANVLLTEAKAEVEEAPDSEQALEDCKRYVLSNQRKFIRSYLDVKKLKNEHEQIAGKMPDAKAFPAVGAIKTEFAALAAEHKALPKPDPTPPNTSSTITATELAARITNNTNVDVYAGTVKMQDTLSAAVDNYASNLETFNSCQQGFNKVGADIDSYLLVAEYMLRDVARIDLSKLTDSPSLQNRNTFLAAPPASAPAGSSAPIKLVDHTKAIKPKGPGGCCSVG